MNETPNQTKDYDNVTNEAKSATKPAEGLKSTILPFRSIIRHRRAFQNTSRIKGD